LNRILGFQFASIYKHEFQHVNAVFLCRCHECLRNIRALPAPAVIWVSLVCNPLGYIGLSCLLAVWSFTAWLDGSSNRLFCLSSSTICEKLKDATEPFMGQLTEQLCVWPSRERRRLHDSLFDFRAFVWVSKLDIPWIFCSSFKLVEHQIVRSSRFHCTSKYKQEISTKLCTVSTYTLCKHITAHKTQI
jgi:hypothetical protein